MANFEVIVNRHVADEFQNEVSCDYCKHKGTVVVLFKQRICKVCIDMAGVAISRAIWKDCGGAHVPGQD